MTTHILGVDTSTIAFAAPLVLVGVAAVSLGMRTRRSRTTRSLASDWPNTRGTVLSATVQVSSQGASRHETPLVLYTYQVNGQVFQGHRVRIDDEVGARINGTATSASTTVARYPAGSCVEVFYDPVNPANSALER